MKLHSEDDSLYQEASRFIEAIRSSGDLADLIERHYGPASRFNPINLAAFQERISADLPALRGMFEEAGRRYLLDWRLLAAMSYQESYWNPSAVSPTGVRGIMMLTETTAGQLGISDRLDARQSILGGAAYLRSLIDRIPARIPDPDRTWIGLAASNVGIDHLEDARILTHDLSDQPDNERGTDSQIGGLVRRLPLCKLSRLGVTGMRDRLPEDVGRLMARVRPCADLPVALGFGIAHPDQVLEACRVADAAVVGSALVNVVAEHAASPDVCEHASEYVRWLKNSL